MDASNNACCTGCVLKGSGVMTLLKTIKLVPAFLKFVLAKPVTSGLNVAGAYVVSYTVKTTTYLIEMFAPCDLVAYVMKKTMAAFTGVPLVYLFKPVMGGYIRCGSCGFKGHVMNVAGDTGSFKVGVKSNVKTSLVK